MQRVVMPRDAAPITDIGCGTGALLAQLADAGYSNLTGTDFAPGCLALAAVHARGARLSLHDITAGPLPDLAELALMTTVIDFVHAPEAALINVAHSLRSDGHLLLTIRNRLAYYPWYHFRGLASRLAPSGRLRHWFLWFTTPLAMRRDDQPVERMYSPGEMRSLLRKCGFQIQSEHGAHLFPMLWIPNLRPAIWAMQKLDRFVWRLPALPICFRYAFVCTRVSNS